MTALRLAISIALPLVGRFNLVTAEALQAPKVARIGYLAGNLAATPSRPEAFRQALLDLGYVEGRNVVIKTC